MGRKRKRWSLTVGGHGHRVTVYERKLGGTLWLKWWDGTRREGKGDWARRSLKHTNQTQGEQDARDLAASILAAVAGAHTGRVTVADLFARYERDVSAHKKGSQPTEDRRRMGMWQRFLGDDRPADSIDYPTLDRFCRERRAGRVEAPHAKKPDEWVKLRANPSDTTIGADIIFLNSVLNFGTKTRLADGTKLLRENPVTGYERPRTKNPKQPVATYDRYLAVRAKADDVDPQRRFGAFMDCIEGLGWRVSAVCALRGTDIDRKQDDDAPFGRLHRRGDTDKEGRDQWIPMPDRVRKALDSIAVIGDLPIFPQARPKDDKPVKSWSRFHARALLARAEKAAGLSPIDGGDFHAYRRGWATSRKHLPAKDVALAGGWRDLRSLERSYVQADAETLRRVVLDDTKLRDRKAAKT